MATATTRRAGVAAFGQVIATVLLSMIFSLLLLTSLGVTRGDARSDDVDGYARALPWIVISVRIVTAFLAGWWAARGLGSGSLKQGLLAGALMVMFALVTGALLGGVIDFWSFVSLLPVVLAAVGGALFARSRSRVAPV